MEVFLIFFKKVKKYFYLIFISYILGIQNKNQNSRAFHKVDSKLKLKSKIKVKIAPYRKYEKSDEIKNENSKDNDNKPIEVEIFKQDSIENLIGKYCCEKMNSKKLYLMKKDLKKINKNSSINEAKIENNEIIYICKENSEEDKKLKIKELNDKKIKILESEKKMKEEKSQNLSISDKEKKINKTLENMCNYGNIIKEEKKLNPQKFITKKETLQLNEDDEFFYLGLFADILEQLGIDVLIEKDKSQINEDEETTIAEYLSNGFLMKKKFNLIFDFGEKRNEILLKNEKEYEIFKNNLKKQLSKDLDIPQEKIIVTNPQKGSFSVQVIFQSDMFDNLSPEEFKQKLNDNFEELKNLKEIHSELIMGAFKISKKLLDPLGNRESGWDEGEKRGGKEYYPPLGWKGFGLKVLGKYEDNEWIGMKNTPGEWCVAYHGVGSQKSSEEVKKIVALIITSTFKQGEGQIYENKKDIYHEGKKVGKGVYCTPKIEIAESFSGISEINGNKYRTVLMSRVKPDKIRSPKGQEDYWIVNGTTDEIRHYRILFKKV